MQELIEKAYAYVEQTLAENLTRHETVISKTKRYIRYDRFYHICRVTAWANRIADELCGNNADSNVNAISIADELCGNNAERNELCGNNAEGNVNVIDRDCLHLASVLHDVGYNAYHISMDHSEAGVVLAEEFLNKEGVNEELKEKILNLIRLHSRKDLMFLEDTPLELVVLMEADLMDDMGATGLVMDAWINTRMNQEETSFDTIYEHIQKYTQAQQREEPMRTEPAKRFWREKQELVEEFMRQFARDLNK